MRCCSATFKSLAQLIHERGGFVAEQLCDGADVDGLRGLYVTGKMSKDETLLVLPPGSCLASDDDVPALTGNQPPLKPFERLIVLLLHRSCQSDAPLSAYFASLPAHVDLLRDWTADELTRLQSAQLVQRVSEQRAHCERTFRRVEELLVRWYPEACKRRKAFDWAESIIRSRTLAAPDSSSSSIGEQRMLLLPTFDLCNHRSRRCKDDATSSGGAQDASCEQDGSVDEVAPPTLVVTDDGGVVMLASCELAPGDELTIEYGSEGNAALLLNYGFAENLAGHQPGAERLHLPLATGAGSAADAEAAAKAAAEVEGGTVGAAPYEICIGSEELDSRAVAALRSLRTGESSVDDLSVEHSACESMLACVNEAVAQLPSTEVSDRSELANLDDSADPSGRRRMALHYRIAQKRQLTRVSMALAALQKRLAHEARAEGGVGAPSAGEQASGRSSILTVCDALHAARS